MEADYFGRAPECFGSNYPAECRRRFINSCAFSNYGYNFPWPLFPYIQNEITLYRAAQTAGKYSVTVVPRPTADSRCNSPPWRCAIFCVTASPMP